MQKNNIGEQSHAPPSRGSIICTASNAGIYPFPIAPLYATSKAGVIGLVRSMARPLARVNIQINALAPAVLGRHAPALAAVPHRRQGNERELTTWLAETNIAPDKALFKDMVVTPMATLVRGVAQLVAEPAVTGAVAEIHGDSVTFRAHPEYVDADSERNLETFWKLGYA